MTGWRRRFDYIRRTWADAGKQIKGGIGKMIDKEIKNERVGMKDLRAMLMKQNYQCALTGKELTPENCSIDHVVPLCKGGAHALENAQLVVAEGNRAKGSLTDEEFLELCSDVVVYADKKRACVV
jgi:CRISPR/Cas system Type II protein with McrA/HNH and RuvC-like nuclease domain